MKRRDEYTLIPGCTLRSIGDRHMLIVYPPADPPFALEINGSFARLFAVAQARESFTENDLIEVLRKDFGLGDKQAKGEISRTLALWKEHGLLQDK